MLILTRKIDERIFIGDDVIVSVLEIEGNRVKLGITAPSEIAILREEIYPGRKVDGAQAAASNVTPFPASKG